MGRKEDGDAFSLKIGLGNKAVQGPVADKSAQQGREGVVIVKTTQAILVTHYPESVQPGAAANTVEQLGDYLIKVGY